jgi:uncharacterized protein
VAVRPEHLARLRRLHADGIVIAAGALEDMSFSVLLLRTNDDSEARAIIEADVYVTAGIWKDITVRPVNLAELSPPPDRPGEVANASTSPD